jgi:hypothetical protein
MESAAAAQQQQQQQQQPRKPIWERSASWREESQAKVKRLEEMLKESAVAECTFAPALISKPPRAVSVGPSPRDLPAALAAAAAAAAPASPPAASPPPLPLALRSSRVGGAVGVELAPAASHGNPLEEARIVAAWGDRGRAPPPPPGAPPD